MIRRALALSLVLAATQVSTAHADEVWRRLPDPALGENPSAVISVSATAVNKVWVAGFSDLDRPCGECGWYSLRKVKDWNGGNWVRHFMPAQPVVGKISQLDAVTTNNVYARGGRYLGRWNGLWWSQIAVPAGAEGFSAIDGDSTGVWAATVRYGFPRTDATLHRWDGSKWTSPYPTGVSEINDIAQRTPSDVWAVGSKIDGRSFVTRWDGTAWQTMPAPVFNADGYLTTVLPLGENDVWGALSTGKLMHWDGTSWTAADTPLRTSLVWPTLVNAYDGDWHADLVGDGSGGIWTTTDATQDGKAALLHYKNGTWNLEPTSLTGADNAITTVSVIPGTSTVVAAGGGTSNAFVITNG